MTVLTFLSGYKSFQCFHWPFMIKWFFSFWTSLLFWHNLPQCNLSRGALCGHQGYCDCDFSLSEHLSQTDPSPTLLSSQKFNSWNRPLWIASSPLRLCLLPFIWVTGVAVSVEKPRPPSHGPLPPALTFQKPGGKKCSSWNQCSRNWGQNSLTPRFAVVAELFNCLSNCSGTRAHLKIL